MRYTEKKCLNGETTSTPNTSTHETGLSLCKHLAAILHEFEIEKNAKNRAYAFILSGGLLEDFKQFLRTQTEEPHSDCLNSILSKL